MLMIGEDKALSTSIMNCLNIKEEVFKENYLSTLQDISVDSAHLTKMTELTDEIINFDEVKTAYLSMIEKRNRGIKSVDGLGYLKKKNSFIMIEFKNGKIKSGDIKEKIKDSLLLYCDITKTNISDTRKNMEFILVHDRMTEERVNSRKDISRHVSKMGNKEFIEFGLESYQGVYFKEVHTYDKEQFDHYIRNNN